MSNETCEAMTNKNNSCRNVKCKDSKVYCFSHLKSCKSLYMMYKTSCQNLWENKCSERMSNAQIENLIKNYNNCIKLRCKYNMNCCNNEIDKEHLGAILKLQRRLKECLIMIKKREQKNIQQEKKFQQMEDIKDYNALMNEINKLTLDYSE